jgi:archaellum component FlaG (FlaF/FlaG flagellin family)
LASSDVATAAGAVSSKEVVTVVAIIVAADAAAAVAPAVVALKGALYMCSRRAGCDVSTSSHTFAQPPTLPRPSAVR